MDGKIDTVREALDRLSGFTYHAADSQDADDIKTVCAALSAIDPEAIRAEARAEGVRLAAARAKKYFDGLPYYEGSYTNGLHAAILGAEPAQDDGEPEDESLQETLDRMDGYGIDNECGARG